MGARGDWLAWGSGAAGPLRARWGEGEEPLEGRCTPLSPPPPFRFGPERAAAGPRPGAVSLADGRSPSASPSSLPTRRSRAVALFPAVPAKAPPLPALSTIVPGQSEREGGASFSPAPERD